MTDAEWLEAVKAGIGGIPAAVTFHDIMLTQKINAVKSYMAGAGVSGELIADALGVEMVTLGVKDLWNLSSGTVAFSDAFRVGLSQLKARSLPDVTEG